MKLSGLRILVTGAGGFIGSHLSDRLAEDNDLVLADDFSVGCRENLEELDGRPRVEIVEADVTDRGHVLELMRGVDVVFHMAISCLRTSLNHPWLNHDTNAGGTLAACVAARECGVRRFVYVSSSEVYGSARTVPMSEDHPREPTTVYGASKLCGELYALAFWRTYGMPVVVVRPFNTYGPREPWHGLRAEVIPRFVLQLLAGRAPVVYGDGSQTRDFTFVEDTVRGLIGAAGCDDLVGRAVNVAYGHEISIGRIAELLREITGVAVDVEYGDPRPGDVLRHYADVSRARRLFDFRPTVDLETGLRRTVAWIEERGLAGRVEAGMSGAPNW